MDHTPTGQRLTLGRINEALYLLRRDPWLFGMKLRGRVRRMFLKPSSGMLKVNGICFPLDVRLDRFMASIFFGSYQAEVLSILRRYLRPGDTFVDVGANIGYLSAFAMGQIGVSGSVHAFEPVAECCASLLRLRELNPTYSLHVNQVACGAIRERAEIMVANCDNVGANTMVPGLLPERLVSRKAVTEVVCLGDYLKENGVRNVRLIKIDTEGFEYPVLRGLEAFLAESTHRPVMLVEVAPRVYPGIGVSLDQMQELIQSYGYSVRDLVCRDKQVLLRELQGIKDVVLVPNQ